MRGGRVPAAVDSFIGRTNLLARVHQRLVTSRLVTLYGVGGGGKTRLALEVAARLERSGEFSDGVWVADLSSATTNDMLLNAVLSAVNAPDQEVPNPLKALQVHLQDKHMLLVLDNCEQLKSAPALASSLLETAPQLRILATSRAPLGIRGEAVEPVEPMAVPPLGAPMPAAPYAEFEAVQLFATLVDDSVPGWSITEANWDGVVELLRWVDGIPLAIELAARRLHSMSLTALLARMSDMSKVFNRNGYAPLHHETLDAMIELSLKLLSEAQTILWARVSTFSGTFTLHAAEQVCADDELPRDQIADALDGLVKYSVVMTTASREGYRLLTPLQQYGAKLCAQRGEQDTLRAKHRDHYRAAAAAAAGAADAGGWNGPDEFDVLDELIDDLDNYRAIMSAPPDPAHSGQQIAANLARTRVWFKMGEMREGAGWLKRTREANPDAPPDLVLGSLALELFIDICIGADQETVRPRLTALAAAAEGLGFVPPVQFAIGVGKLWLDADLAGVPLVASAYNAFRAAGPDTYGDAVMALLMEAVGEALMADQAPADAAAARLIAETERSGAPWMIRWAQWCEAIVEMRFRDPARAVDNVERLLRERTDIVDSWLTMWLIEVLAWATAKAGDARRAAVLLGVSSQLNAKTGVRVHKVLGFARLRHEAQATAEKRLGKHDYADAFAYGEAFVKIKDVAVGSRKHLIAAARNRALEASTPSAVDAAARNRTLEASTPQAVADSPWNVLTATEKDLARLIGNAKTNQEIAHIMGISKRTVDAHMRNIRFKVGITDRVRLATWALTHDPTPPVDQA